MDEGDDEIDVDIDEMGMDQGEPMGQEREYPPENSLEAEFKVMTPAGHSPGVTRDLVLSNLKKSDEEELGRLQGAMLQARNIEAAGNFQFPSLRRFIDARYNFLVNSGRARGGFTFRGLRTREQRLVQTSNVNGGGGGRPRKKILGFI